MVQDIDNSNNSYDVTTKERKNRKNEAVLLDKYYISILTMKTRQNIAMSQLFSRNAINAKVRS